MSSLNEHNTSLFLFAISYCSELEALRQTLRDLECTKLGPLRRAATCSFLDAMMLQHDVEVQQKHRSCSPLHPRSPLNIANHKTLLSDRQRSYCSSRLPPGTKRSPRTGLRVYVLRKNALKTISTESSPCSTKCQVCPHHRKDIVASFRDKSGKYICFRETIPIKNNTLNRPSCEEISRMKVETRESWEHNKKLGLDGDDSRLPQSTHAATYNMEKKLGAHRSRGKYPSSHRHPSTKKHGNPYWPFHSLREQVLQQNAFRAVMNDEDCKESDVNPNKPASAASHQPETLNTGRELTAQVSDRVAGSSIQESCFEEERKSCKQNDELYDNESKLTHRVVPSPSIFGLDHLRPKSPGIPNGSHQNLNHFPSLPSVLTTDRRKNNKTAESKDGVPGQKQSNPSLFSSYTRLPAIKPIASLTNSSLTSSKNEFQRDDTNSNEEIVCIHCSLQPPNPRAAATNGDLSNTPSCTQTSNKLNVFSENCICDRALPTVPTSTVLCDPSCAIDIHPQFRSVSCISHDTKTLAADNINTLGCHSHQNAPDITPRNIDGKRIKEQKRVPWKTSRIPRRDKGTSFFSTPGGRKFRNLVHRSNIPRWMAP